MLPHTLSLKEFLYLSYTEDLSWTFALKSTVCSFHACYTLAGETGVEGEGKVDPMHQPPHTVSHSQFRSATSIPHASFPLRASISLAAVLQFIFFFLGDSTLSTDFLFLTGE